MIRKRPEKDVVNPPGQVVYPPPGPDTLLHNIEQWKKLQQQRNHAERQMCSGCGNKYFPSEVPHDCLISTCPARKETY